MGGGRLFRVLPEELAFEDELMHTWDIKRSQSGAARCPKEFAVPVAALGILNVTGIIMLSGSVTCCSDGCG
jgi:hypothetical protein